MASLRSFQWWALAVGFGISCSVNHAGFPGTDPSGSGGSGGASAVPDAGAAGTGGVPVSASGGAGTPGSGGNVAAATGGRAASGGADAGGASGEDAAVASGGRTEQGAGGADSGGASGPGDADTGGGGMGGASRSGGRTGSNGGAPGTTGGAPGTGGRPGTGGFMAATGGAGTGGAGTGGLGTGGRPATGGAPGTGGKAATGGSTGNCSLFPEAVAFAPPTDNRTHCYWFRSELRNWDEARKSCREEAGADLVTILSPSENDFVRALAKFTGSFPQVWIGATDGLPATNDKGPGTYKWVVPGDAWTTYTNWNQNAPRQPDGYCDPCDGERACTCDHRGTMAADGTWFDFWEENPRGYVCEAVASD